jgi:hypothetical protein
VAQEPTSVSSWKKAGHDFAVPSGNVCRVRRRSLDVFLKTGRIPNSLMPWVQKAIQGKAETDINKEDLSIDQVKDMMEFIDIVVLDTVLEPKVYPVPPDGEERDPELLYVDEVDFDDKAAIFEFSVKGVGRFKSGYEEPTAAMEPVSGSEDVAMPAEPTPSDQR